jgi:hypothetical protein
MEMRKWVLTAACVFVAAGTASGDLGWIVGSFPIPGRYCAGLARSNDVLFSCNQALGIIYRCNYLNGSITGSFPATGGITGSGLAYQSGGYLWQNRGIGRPATIYKKNALSGSVYSSYPIPKALDYTTGTAPLATGDGGEGTTQIIVSNFDECSVTFMTTTGSYIDKWRVYPLPFIDIAYDWRNQLVWGGSPYDPVVYGCNVHRVVASFRVPGGKVYGITYHGQYLWLAADTGYVYRIHCPGPMGVRPASMGKIRAMFN